MPHVLDRRRGTDWVTVKVLADEWGVSQRTVRELFRSRRLRGVKVGKAWQTTRRAAAAFVEGVPWSGQVVEEPVRVGSPVPGRRRGDGLVPGLSAVTGRPVLPPTGDVGGLAPGEPPGPV